MAYLARLAEERVFRPIIDRIYSFDDIVSTHRRRHWPQRANVVARSTGH